MLWQPVEENSLDKITVAYTKMTPRFVYSSQPYFIQSSDPHARLPLAPKPTTPPSIIQARHLLTRHTHNTRIRRRKRPNKIKAVIRILGLCSRDAKRLRDETQLHVFPANEHVSRPRKGRGCGCGAGIVVALDGGVGCEAEDGGEGCYGFDGSRTGAICFGLDWSVWDQRCLASVLRSEVGTGIYVIVVRKY